MEVGYGVSCFFVYFYDFRVFVWLCFNWICVVNVCCYFESGNCGGIKFVINKNCVFVCGRVVDINVVFVRIRFYGENRVEDGFC